MTAVLGGPLDFHIPIPPHVFKGMEVLETLSVRNPDGAEIPAGFFVSAIRRHLTLPLWRFGTLHNVGEHRPFSLGK